MSQEAKTGGPAFPTDNEAQIGPSTFHFSGMTLRAYIAAKCLPHFIEDLDPRPAAEMACVYADALLAQLEKAR